MSDPANCERCGVVGRRRRGYVAPEGWYFATFALSPDGDHDPGDLLVVFACSEICRDALWTKMAGHKWDVIECRVDVKSEVLRFSAHVAADLREHAQRIRTGAWSGSPDAELHAGARVAGLLESTAEHLERAAEREVEALRSTAPLDDEVV